MDMLIFDMDGVILNSEPLHQKARIMLSEENGIYISDDDLPNPVGKSSSEFWQCIFDTAGKKGLCAKEFERKQFALVGQLAMSENTGCNEGLIDLLKWCVNNNIIISLASSSNRQLVDYILDGLDIRKYFSYTVAGDEVVHVKPAPDIYEKILEMSGISKENACAIEDSAAGIKAAKSAGVFCYGYYNPTSGKQDLSEADAVIDKLIQVKSGA